MADNVADNDQVCTEPPSAAAPGTNQAAAQLLEQSKAARRLPGDARQELDLILRNRRNRHPSLDDIWHDLQLKKRFGITRRMLYEYSICLASTVDVGVCGPAQEALAGLLAMPVEQGSHLHEAGYLLLLARVSDVLQKQELEPEQLCRIADAMSRQRTAAARASLADLAGRKFRHDLRACHSAAAGSAAISMQQRIRQIYGLDMPATGTAAKPEESNPSREADL